MIRGRTLLLLDGFGFLAFGFLFLFWPRESAWWVGISVESATAVADIRATYGGFEVGIGLFLLVCTLFPPARTMGFLAASLSLLGFVGGRTLGLILDGVPDKISFFLLAFECLALVLNIGFLLKGRGPGK